MYLSVSKLDAFRLMATTDWKKESEVVDAIKGTATYGWQAKYGTGLHGCIEDPPRWWSEDQGKYIHTDRDGTVTSWPREIVDACASAWPRPCVFEQSFKAEYSIDNKLVTLGGRIDAEHGLVIVEGKTKFGYFDPFDYSDSIQWRCYLDANQWAKCVEYRVHEIGGMYTDKETGDLRFSKSGPILEEIHAWKQWRQDDTHETVVRWLREFISWAESRGLTGYLKPWERVA